MKDSNRIRLISVLAGLLVWSLDAVLDPAMGERSFLSLLLLGSSGHDLLMRSFIFSTFLVFGFLTAGIFEKRRKIEYAFAEKSAYLDNILRSSTEHAIATTDVDFRITYYNPLAEKIFGYTAGEAVGKTVQEIHTKEKVSKEKFDEAIKSVKDRGERVYMIKRETPQGIRAIKCRVSCIYDKKGRLIGYANFAKDVTEEKRAEEEKELLIAELRDALTRVRTLSGLLPICAYCKKIRDDEGYWNQIETYIRKHSTAEFTHSICPDCEKRALDESKESYPPESVRRHLKH